MGIETAIAVVGLGLAAGGTYKQYESGKKAAKSSQAAEAARRRQMELESMRKRREIIRNSIIANSTALANATNQGAAGGSGLPGGYGQIAGLTGQQIISNNENLQIGRQIFDANAAQSTAQASADFGRSLFGFGSMLVSQAPTLSNITETTLFGNRTEPAP